MPGIFKIKARVCENVRYVGAKGIVTRNNLVGHRMVIDPELLREDGFKSVRKRAA